MYGLADIRLRINVLFISLSIMNFNDTRKLNVRSCCDRTPTCINFYWVKFKMLDQKIDGTIT